MKQTLSLSVLASALLLAGCGDETSSQTNPPQYEPHIKEALSRATGIKFTLQGKDASVPVPSFALMNTSDGTLEIPTKGDDALTNPVAAMGTMDGWSTSMPLVMNFQGAGLASGLVPSGVYLIELTDSMTGDPHVKTVLTQNADYIAMADANTDNINIVMLNNRELNASSEYILAITDEVVDANGDPVGTSQSYAALKSKSKFYTTEPLATAQKVTQGVEGLFASQGVNSDNIIYSTWFTTQSVGNTLQAVKGATATGLSLVSEGKGDLGDIWKGVANPNNVDLSTAYGIAFGATESFITALDADTDFDKYIGEDDTADKKAGIKALYASAGADVSVTQGQIALPYYLETGPNWNQQPMQSAMPSLAKISEVMEDATEQPVIAAQLMAAEIDPTQLATSKEEQLKLVGLTLTKADGSQLDSERIITRYAPVPQVKSLQPVEFLLFTPAGGTPSDVVIYQHGITSAKENAYSFAFNLAQTGLAVIAIDLPMHGTRSLDDQRSANTDVQAYLNLTNLTVGRDNVRQSALDVLGLRASLTANAAAGRLAGTPLALFNPSTSKVKLLGHSMGGIVATTAVAAGNKTLGDAQADALYRFSAAAIHNSGGQIANLLFGSDEFGPLLKHNLALAASVEYKSFAD
ncbi:VolA/Pla-1 family phospholipase, partial [Vibrio sp.]|uniref:VolA/Pla-1 family phospholipase n=1 Tax=Vibrio sp. TaxID=678 RepID=UPI003D0F927F